MSFYSICHLLYVKLVFYGFSDIGCKKGSVFHDQRPFSQGSKKGLVVTTNSYTAMRKGDPQDMLRGKIKVSKNNKKWLFT